MTNSLFRTALLGGASVALLFAHYTWLTTEAPFEKGKTATIVVGHGHRFPATGEAIDAKGLQLRVVSPSGATTPLRPRQEGARWVAEFPVRESGPHRIVLEQDRGVSSRTPDGVRPGGRDRNPNAIQAFRTYRSAVSYTAAGPVKPLNLDFELLAQPAGAGWQLQLLRSGAPVPGALIEMLAPGENAVKIGTTDSGGRLSYNKAVPGPVVFAVELSVPAPAGAGYDTVNLSTSAAVAR
jgi:hypothetical protein